MALSSMKDRDFESPQQKEPDLLSQTKNLYKVSRCEGSRMSANLIPNYYAKPVNQDIKRSTGSSIEVPLKQFES